ncbi:hypothetical protein BJX76DRAFT_279874 [Aspergillus varians]
MRRLLREVLLHLAANVVNLNYIRYESGVSGESQRVRRSLAGFGKTTERTVGGRSNSATPRARCLAATHAHSICWPPRSFSFFFLIAAAATGDPEILVKSQESASQASSWCPRPSQSQGGK